MVYGKSVTIEWNHYDKYRRPLGTVYVDGINVNFEQVKRGMTWVPIEYARDPAYFAAEKAARAARIGLWIDPNPVPPWEFRHCGGTFCAKKNAEKVIAAPGTCGEKRYCKQMNDCAEATHYLNDCGLDKLDKDGDGVPCESLCK